MKTMKHIQFRAFVCLLLLAGVGVASAALSVKVAEPKSTGTKAVVNLTMKNTFTNAVESARAAVFLMDDQGKVVGQATRWVIGGAKDRPALEPDKDTTYHFVVPLNKAMSGALQTRVPFNRLILAGGQSAGTPREVTVKPVNAVAK